MNQDERKDPARNREPGKLSGKLQLGFNKESKQLHQVIREEEDFISCGTGIYNPDEETIPEPPMFFPREDAPTRELKKVAEITICDTQQTTVEHPCGRKRRILAEEEARLEQITTSIFIRY